MAHLSDTFFASTLLNYSVLLGKKQKTETEQFSLNFIRKRNRGSVWSQF